MIRSVSIQGCVVTLDWPFALPAGISITASHPPSGDATTRSDVRSSADPDGACTFSSGSHQSRCARSGTLRSFSDYRV